MVKMPDSESVAAFAILFFGRFFAVLQKKYYQ